jgi:adenosylhomocysteine nucleosidase
VEDHQVEPGVDVSARGDARPPIIFFAALRQELTGLEKGLAVEDQRLSSNCRQVRARYGAREVLLAQTGPGRDNAQRAARLVLDERRPRLAIALGYAGALTVDLEIADLVLCEEVYRLGDGATLSSPVPCDQGLLELASKALERGGLAAHRGNSVTVDEECSDPRAKEGLGRLGPVQVVEMENYWLAREARERGVPFVAVRAISDTLDQPLPEGCDFVDQRGETDVGRAALHVLRHPGSVLPILRLGRDAGKATANLTAFATAFLELW